MSSTPPIRVSALQGRVTKKKYGKGSKSERDAVYIQTADTQLILRRKNGPVYADAELERYIGREVKCDGFLVGTTLLAERIEVAE